MRGSWLPLSKLIREEDDTFSGGGISLKSLESFRTWKVEFQGCVENLTDQKKYEVRLFHLFLC